MELNPTTGLGTGAAAGAAASAGTSAVVACWFQADAEVVTFLRLILDLCVVAWWWPGNVLWRCANDQAVIVVS